MTTALRRLRLQTRCQSLRELAADVGVSYETVRRLERGETVGVHPRTRRKFQDALGLPFDMLMRPEDENGAAPEEDDAVNTGTTAKRSEVHDGS